MPSQASAPDANPCDNGSNGGAEAQVGQVGQLSSSACDLSGLSLASLALSCPDGVPSATVSAAFHGRRFLLAAERQLIDQHAELAERIAKGLSRPGGVPVPFEELRSAAYEGLCLAALRYEPGRGSFQRCAGVWIRRQVFERIRRGEGLMWRPRRAMERARKLSAQRQQLAQQYSREVSDEELAGELLPSAPRPHERRLPESPARIRELDDLLNPSFLQLLPNDRAFSVEVGCEDPLPPLSPLLQELLGGASVAAIAAQESQTVEQIEARILRDLRPFFSC